MGKYIMGGMNMMEKDVSEMSFEEARAAMLRAISKFDKGPVIIKTIPFTNNDVPEFLKKLDEFEAESRKSVIMAGALCSMH